MIPKLFPKEERRHNPKSIYHNILDFRIANGKIDQCAAQGLRASAVGQFTQWA